jgi:hypothetical protein
MRKRGVIAGLGVVRDPRVLNPNTILSGGQRSRRLRRDWSSRVIGRLNKRGRRNIA